MTEAILERGANPDIQNGDGQTALHTAIQLDPRSCRMVDILLQAGSSPSILDEDTKTVLHLTKCAHCAKGIITASSAEVSKDNTQKHALNIQDVMGHTPLMSLIAHPKGQETIDIGTLMIESEDGEVSINDKEFNNCLHLAAASGSQEIFTQIVMKVLNLGIAKSDKLIYSKNSSGDDIMKLSILARSRENVNILSEIANYRLEPEHLQLAKKKLGGKN